MDDEGCLEQQELAVRPMQLSATQSWQSITQGHLKTYKPTQPGNPSIISKNVICDPTGIGSAIRPRDQENRVQGYPSRQRPVLLKLIPVMRIDLF